MYAKKQAKLVRFSPYWFLIVYSPYKYSVFSFYATLYYKKRETINQYVPYFRCKSPSFFINCKIYVINNRQKL